MMLVNSEDIFVNTFLVGYVPAIIRKHDRIKNLKKSYNIPSNFSSFPDKY